MKYTIDAKGKKVGRVATEAATYLMGKNRTDFARNTHPEVSVEIINCAKASITEKKKGETIYATFTGFRGGLNHESMEKLIERKGFSEIFRRAVEGMLPKNKLQKQMLKNLTITE